MKILLIHSYYQKKGGEDVTFEQESQLLAQAATVRQLSFSNRAGLRGALQFFLSIWNIRAASKLRRAIREFQPDIIHCHNLHFGIGPIAICVAKKRGIPFTLTLQNFRLLCPSATLALDGELFTDSLGRSFPWEAIRRKAYRNSALLSFWLAFIIWFHKKIGTWKKVDAYIVLTDFARSIFVNSSFAMPAEKIVIKANSVEFLPSPFVERGQHFLFVGRLSMEKGITLLLDAFGQTGFTLHIAGEGPMEAQVREAARRHANIQYLGPLSREQVRIEMSACTALVFPSIWYEGFPLTILEAFASRTPVIASNLGAMASMIVHGYNGHHFDAGNTQSLIEQLKTWSDIDKEKKEQYRENALASYYANYAPEKNREHLLRTYKQQLRRGRQLILLLLFASRVFAQTGPYYSKEENQFSAYLKISKFMNHNTELGITSSLEHGGLFYNPAAFVLHARRIF